MVGYIYLITDTTNGMKYAGKHHYDKPELDPNYHGSGTIIKNIYKKRPETLKEEYIKTCYSEDEMSNDEKHYIKVFNTLYPNGYNLTEGGDGGICCDEICRKISEAKKGKLIGEKNPFYGKTHSEETRRKISKSLKGVKHSEESRRKMSESRSGEKNIMFGKHHSEETRRKIRKSLKGKIPPNKGKQMSEEQKKKLSKTVLQLSLTGELIREWSSVSECSRNGFYQSAVSECCCEKRKSHKGFIWKYKEV